MEAIVDFARPILLDIHICRHRLDSRLQYCLLVADLGYEAIWVGDTVEFLRGVELSIRVFLVANFFPLQCEQTAVHQHCPGYNLGHSRLERARTAASTH